MASIPLSASLADRKRIAWALKPSMVTPSVKDWMDNGPPDESRHLIIDLNTNYPGGITAARQLVQNFVATVSARALERNQPNARHTFVFADLTVAQLADLLTADAAAGRVAQMVMSNAPLNEQPVVHRHSRAIHKVWLSLPIAPLTTVSVRTVKADAAHSSFSALGQGITWAVLDSGVREDHPHFTLYENLKVTPPLQHKAFTPRRADDSMCDPLKDEFGHGTHVAGIIAGTASSPEALVALQSVDASGTVAEFHIHLIGPVCGMAPKCKILSVRVLDDAGNGDVTAVISALEWLMEINGDGNNPLVHGVNLSAGYLPDPETYGSGQSPICRQVNRAVKSGLVVVVAAGNYGYAATSTVQQAGALRQWNAGVFASISDPANAELAIAVGSVHREEPHRYGVSYFSSKGPTSDGRPKPDVVAPGERILSCAAGAAKERVKLFLLNQQQTQAPTPAAGTPPATAVPQGAAPAQVTAMQVAAAANEFDYVEDSGTSMAAPHVSGVVAAFLSVQRDFIGEPEKVSALIATSATDLKRDANLQGSGLVDLFRMLQSV